jgi:MarR family transcriptional regulator for hemolysin
MTQYPGTDSFNFLIIDIARLIRSEFARRVEDARIGVTGAEARVLVHAARRGPVRQNMLAESLGISQMSLTGFVCKLEKAGLVRRETDPDDRRANIIRLTGEAGKTLSAIDRIGSEITAIAAGRMGGPEMELLRTELSGIRDRLEEARQSGLGGRGGLDE